MEPGVDCPFCGAVIAISQDTFQKRFLAFENYNVNQIPINPDEFTQPFAINMVRCPRCGKCQIVYKSLSGPDKGNTVHIYPKSLAKKYPSYIPTQIRSDYEEACAIVDLSPKASATLSRRCLQGMIHDYWKINKGNLAKEINELEGKIPAEQWKVINGLRRLGNIGAHMEKDVNLIADIEPNEAQKLIKLIELLMKEWYINRHEQQQLFNDILTIDEQKQTKRKSD